MLFRRNACQRLEPVRIVRRTLFNRPFHHGFGNDIGSSHRDLSPILLDIHNLLLDLTRQALAHDSLAEYIFAE